MTLKVQGLRSWDFSLRLPPLSVKRSLLIYGTIAMVATSVMTPRMRAPNFGLLDDGVTISVSSYILQEFKAGNLGVLFGLESERGRFKPLSILYYVIPYAISGASSFGFFVAQWLSLILTGMVIFKVVEVATKDWLASILSSMVFVLSPPAFENYYTLSKGEPPIVLWIALSLFFLWRSADLLISDRKRGQKLLIVSVFFLSIAYFTKETAHAMFLVSILWAVSALYQVRNSPGYRIFNIEHKYFIMNLIVVSAYWGARILCETAEVSSGEDSSHYKFMPETLFRSLLRHAAWYIRDFPYLIPILLFWTGLMFKVGRCQQSSRDQRMLDGVFWIAGWTAIMLPWHSTLEYYLLPATLGVATVAGIGVSVIVQHLWDPSKVLRKFARMTLVCVLVTGSISLANGFTNGRVQVSVDSANSELIDYLALNIPINGTLLVNLPEPNEYVFEIGLHLAVLKQRQDIHVRYFNSFNLSTDSAAFIVTPVMKNQPYPSVRIAVQEGGSKIWQSELHAQLGNKARVVYRKVEEVVLFTMAVEKTICPLLIRADVQDGVYCGVKKPTIDTRIFHYGWEVYRI